MHWEGLLAVASSLSGSGRPALGKVFSSSHSWPGLRTPAASRCYLSEKKNIPTVAMVCGWWHSARWMGCRLASRTISSATPGSPIEKGAGCVRQQHNGRSQLENAHAAHAAATLLQHAACDSGSASNLQNTRASLR